MRTLFIYTTECDVAHTALCFMIKSLTCKYRDIVDIFPMKSLKAESLFNCYKEVLQLLHDIGFNVAAICVDNASANRKFYTEFLCSGSLSEKILNPFNGLNIYLLFDPTHNLKNLYNNFQSRKLFKCPAFPPLLEKPSTASFNDIESVYTYELDKPLKMAYKLHASVLQPKSIEKTNVQLAVSVFHESTINALKHHQFIETASVLTLFLKLWNVLNVRTTTIGKHKRDSSRDPVTSANDWKLLFLEEFADFLDEWEKAKVCMTMTITLDYTIVTTHSN